jgi:hypothetical protein
MADSGLNFGLNVYGEEQLRFALREIPIRDWTEWWPAAIGIIKNILRARFVAQGDRPPTGEWAPLSEEYAKRKEKKYPGAPILQARGDLYDSLVSESEHTIKELEATRMAFGTDLAYARYLHDGWLPSHYGSGGRLGAAVEHLFGVRSIESRAWHPDVKVAARKIFAFMVPEDTRSLQRSAIRWAATKERKLGFRVLGSGADPGEARLAGIAGYEQINAGMMLIGPGQAAIAP